jgi:hypothetical protein
MESKCLKVTSSHEVSRFPRSCPATMFCLTSSPWQWSQPIVSQNKSSLELLTSGIS